MFFGMDKLYICGNLKPTFMKIKNIFKKETVKAKASVVALDKKQLEKVVGGTETVAVEEPKKKGLNAVNVS